MKMGLFSLIWSDLRRNTRHFVLASVGIVVGIASFAFFLGLSSGVRQVVLGKIFPLDKLEVRPRNVDLDLGPLRVGMGRDSLDDAAIEKIRGIPNVADVYPKMKLTVPATAVGGKELFGNSLRTELIADGVEPDLVASEVGGDYKFTDYEATSEATTEPPKRCRQDADCGGGQYCESPEESRAPQCRNYIPVLASHHIVQLYNGALRRAHGFPKLNPEFVVGFRFKVRFGDSMVQASKKGKTIQRRAQLVGFSDKAISIGMTIPIGYVKRLNAEFDAPAAATRYHSAVLSIESKDHVAGVAKAVQDLGFDVTDQGAEQAAVLIAVVTSVFGLVSAVIVGIAAVNIMHVFFMLVFQRQREIGIMRAVGASRWDIQRLILGQAAVVGLLAGALGVACAVLAAQGIDALSENYIPDFPYKPQTYFDFGPTLVGMSLTFAVAFCVAGAYLPARRAAKMDPAPVLTGNV